MTQQIKPQTTEILDILAQHPEGLSRGQISEKLRNKLENKTLQRRLADLVEKTLIRKEGDRKDVSVRYAGFLGGRTSGWKSVAS